ncbi:hypothetical protein [Yoonia sp. MH D7]
MALAPIISVGVTNAAVAQDTGPTIAEINENDFPNNAVSDTTRVKPGGKVDTHLLREVDIQAEHGTIVE